MSHNPHNLQPGQIVVLDKDFHNSIEVKIISFSPLGMYANVLPVGGTIPYPVMSDRLSPKKTNG